MDFLFSELQQGLYEEFAQIGTIVAANVEKHDKDASFDFVAWRALSDAGLWQIPVPKELGGLGGSWQDCMVAIEGLASTANDIGFLISTLGHIGSLRVILSVGTDAQKERWLGALMQGDVAVTAMTEPTGGSDLARMQLSAHIVGDHWLLNGAKCHITNAPVAKLGMVAGRMPELGAKKDITLFFVETKQPQLKLGELEDNLGIRTSPTADMIFNDYPLDRENILGAPGNGLELLYDIIAFERALYGVIAAGAIEQMCSTSMERVEERYAFGKPLADNQYVQGRITDMKISSQQCRLMSYASLQGLDCGEKEASINCSITKFIAGETILSAAEHMVQLHGHLGFMNNDISRALRDAVGMRIAGGTSDIQRINIFNQLRRQYKDQRDGVHRDYHFILSELQKPDLDRFHAAISAA